MMRVEILVVDGCPNAAATRDLVRQALSLETIDAAIEMTTMRTAEAARQMRFLGSPSVRVNGKDIEPSANARIA
jgi:glutaredoxin